MALVKFGAGIVQMSGSIAGTTHAHNRSGNYVRARTTPVNPRTAKQTAVRSAVSFLCEQWSSTLSAANRTAWNLYASSVAMKNKLGETIYLSGFNHFIRSNTSRKALGVAIVTAGPVIFELPAHDPTFSFAVSEATQSITASYDETMGWAVETGGWIFMYQGQPQNAQRNFFDGPWRYWGAVTGIDPGGPAPPHVDNVQFAVAEGQHQWLYARISRADGRLSEIFRADSFCLA